PRAGPDELPTAPLVFAIVCPQAFAVPAIVDPLPAVVRVAVVGAPLPEVARAAGAAPAVATVPAPGPAPESACGLPPPARGPALESWHRGSAEHVPCHRSPGCQAQFSGLVRPACRQIAAGDAGRETNCHSGPLVRPRSGCYTESVPFGPTPFAGRS